MNVRVGLAGWSLVVFCLAACASPWAAAQGGGGFGGPGGRGGQFMANPLMLLRSEQVQKSLEIVEDQAAQIEEISNEMQSVMREAFQNFRDMSDEERQKKMTELNDEFQAKIDEVLLPHQQKRLKQIALQQRSRGGSGLAGALSDGELVKQLKITEDQKEEMQKVAEEARKEMDEKVAKARKEMEEKILGVLDPEQREKYQEMVGEPFELDMRQMFRGGPGGQNGRGGNNGGRGGRGGGNGGGNGGGGGRNDF